MILVSFNLALKLTLCKPWTIYVVAVVCTLFVLETWQMAAGQSKTQIADWINNRPLMLNTSVVISIEVLIHISYCIMAVHLQNSGMLKKRTIYMYRVLRLYPGILILLVLLHCETVAMFTFTGTDFKVIAYTLSAIVLAGIPALTYLFRRLVPEKDLRLEILFLSNALIAILAVVATTNGSTAVSGISEVNLQALILLAVVILIFATIGLISYKVRYSKKINHF